ncbi:MAG: methionyl-tRNA formyltransferase [Bdellovibrionia bacterium]
MLRVVLMGTPEFAVPSLVEVAKRHQVVAVYTQPDKPVGRGLEMKSSAVKVKALELGIPVFQPEKLSMEGEWERLAQLNPDVIVVVAYGQILRKNVLTLPRLGCINVHSSLLPRWRGAAPIQWSILAGDVQTGVTTMRLVEKLDAGDILLQKKTPITSEDTAETLHDRLALMGAELLIPTLEGLAQGTLKGIAQEESQVTYAAKLTKSMEVLDPNQSAEELARRVRALNPWPGTILNFQPRIKIKQAQAHPDLHGHVGQIYEKAGMLLLGTERGALQLLRLSWEGKKEVDASGFLNGLKGRGQKLPLSTHKVGPIS